MNEYTPVSLEESRRFAENWKAPPQCTDSSHVGICFPKSDGTDICGREWK